MSCLARPPSSPTRRKGRSPARSRSTSSREHYRREWNARGAALGLTRIGVHAGPAIVGNFGGGRLFDYTAYGDTINAAARLEAVNEQLGTRICVSAAAAERAPGFIGRPVGDLRLRGRTRAAARLRAAGRGQGGSPGGEGLCRRLRQARSPRSGRRRRFRRAREATPGRSAGAISSQAASERRGRDGDRDAIGGRGRSRLPAAAAALDCRQ